MATETPKYVLDPNGAMIVVLKKTTTPVLTG